MKKIVIFSWRGPKHPNEGGAEIATHEHAKAWVRDGYDVTLFTSTSLGLMDEETIDGVKIIRQGNQLGSVYLKACIWFRKLEVKPDLIIDQFHGIPFFTVLYSKSKVLAYIHEVAREVWFMNHLVFPLNYIYGSIGYLFEPIIFRLLYRNVDFMTVSESTKNDLVRFGVKADGISVINNGLNTVKVNCTKSKTKTIIYLGALAKDKGIEDALKCFGDIHKIETGWQYWVVGKGDPRIVAEMKLLARQYGIEKQIKFWGFVSEKKKFELLASSHLMINPSKHEGWGLVNIEANSVGTPVLGYKVQGVKDSIVNNKTGVLCDIGDYKTMSKEAVKLVKDSKRYKKFADESLAWANRFSWADSTNKSAKLIKGILSN